MKDAPGAAEALRWLLHLPPGLSQREVLRRARRAGVLSAEGQADERVDGKALSPYLRRLPPLPGDQQAAVGLLMGLGELKARGHTDLRQALLPAVRRCLHRIPARTVLDTAARLAYGAKPPYRDSMGRAGTIAAAGLLDWRTFRDANTMIQHPDFGFSRRWGFLFVAQLVLEIAPNLFGCWMASKRAHPCLTPLVALVLNPLIWSDPAAQQLARRMLRWPMPFLRCAGAAALVRADDLDDGPSIAACWQTLVESGLAPGDALWMSAARLKQAIHRWYQLEHKKQNLGQSLTSIEQNRTTAPQGYAREDYMQWLTDQLEDVTRQFDKHLPRLEGMLTELAACWPAEGLDDAQAAQLEPVFVDSPEYRYRLAEKLGDRPDTRRLLKKNIDQFFDLVGLTHGHRPDHSSWDDERDGNILTWAARSWVALHGRNSGKKAGQHLNALIRPVRDLPDEPFLYARQPEVWQSAVGRLAMCDLFAFTVAGMMPKEHRNSVSILLGHALDLSVKLLAAAGHWWRTDDPRLDHLAQSAVWFMVQDPGRRDALALWADNPFLPAFPRALAAWALTAADPSWHQPAEALLLVVAQPPASTERWSVEFQRLVTLLDVAAAAGGGGNSLVSLWARAYAPWDQRTQGRRRDIAATLVAAVAGAGPERQAILADPAFARSYCRDVIEGRLTLGAQTA